MRQISVQQRSQAFLDVGQTASIVPSQRGRTARGRTPAPAASSSASQWGPQAVGPHGALPTRGWLAKNSTSAYQPSSMVCPQPARSRVASSAYPQPFRMACPQPALSRIASSACPQPTSMAGPQPVRSWVASSACPRPSWSRVACPAISVRAPSTVESRTGQVKKALDDVVVPVHGSCLRTLQIKDFALVADQTLVFSPELNVITGESGAGKSVMVEALSQLSGAPSPPDCVRQPAVEAIIEGTYILGSAAVAAARDILSACSLPQRSLPLVGHGQQQLLIRRQIVQQAGGNCRSKCYINGAATSLRVLRELSTLLMDSNGQHSSTMLKDPSTQLALLDRIAATTSLAMAVSKSLSEIEDLESKLVALEELQDEEEREQLQSVCDAVGKARLQSGEELTLRQSLKRMEAKRSSVEQCGLARMAIVGDRGGLVGAVRSVETQLNSILRQEQQMAAAAAGARRAAKQAAEQEAGEDGEFDDDSVREDVEEEDEEEDEGDSAALSGTEQMEEALDALVLCREQLGIAETAVRSFAREYQWDQVEHDQTSKRLKMIERLLRQHKCRSSMELLDLEEQCSSRLEQYYEAEGCQEDWEERLHELHALLRQDCVTLSARRRAAAGSLKASVESCLRELSMGGSRFDVRINWRPAEEAYSGKDDFALLEEEGIWLSDADIKVSTMRHPGAYPQTVGVGEVQGSSTQSAAHTKIQQAAADSVAKSATRSSSATSRVAEDHLTRSSSSPDSAQANAQSYEKGFAQATSTASPRFDTSLPSTSSFASGADLAPAAWTEAEEDEEYEAGHSQKSKRDSLQGQRFMVGSSGLDWVEFLLAAGPSEPLRPLSAVASGGESARIMLALKAAPCAVGRPYSVSIPAPSPTLASAPASTQAPSTSLEGGGTRTSSTSSTSTSPRRGEHSAMSSSGDPHLDAVPQEGSAYSEADRLGSVEVEDEVGGPLQPTLVLDELDSGIGARLGASVGQILRRMSSAGTSFGSSAGQGTDKRRNASQIICVTHLPQVACCATKHIKVMKSEASADGRIVTEFQTLSSWDARAEEVAAMLGLERDVAEDMLKSAQGEGFRV